MWWKGLVCGTCLLDLSNIQCLSHHVALLFVPEGSATLFFQVMWHITEVLEIMVLSNSFLSDVTNSLSRFNVCWSAHHSTVHKEKSNKMQQCIKFYYSIFTWSSTCFGRHTAHHQEPKTALTAFGFSYLEVCLVVWLVDVVRHSTCLTTSTSYTSKQPSTYEKPEAASAVLGSWWLAVCRLKHFELHVNME